MGTMEKIDFRLSICLLAFLVSSTIHGAFESRTNVDTNSNESKGSLELLRNQIDLLKKDLFTSDRCGRMRKVDGSLEILLPSLLEQQQDGIVSTARVYANLTRRKVDENENDDRILSFLRTFMDFHQHLSETGFVKVGQRRAAMPTLFQLYTAIRIGKIVNSSSVRLTELDSVFIDWKSIHINFMQQNIGGIRNRQGGKSDQVLALQKDCYTSHGQTRKTGRWNIVLVLGLASNKLDQLPSMFYVTFPLNRIDLNQCDEGTHEMLRSSHGCTNWSMCVFIPHGGFELGHYQCCCQAKNNSIGSSGSGEGHPIVQCIDGRLIEQEQKLGRIYSARCVEYYQANYAMRRFMLSINILCALAAFALIFIVTTQRKVKDWGARGWALMEFFLIGAILLYCIVILEYFPPSTSNCCLIPWCRELGFALFYGTVVLKIHRNLFEHGIRKANYVFIKEKDLLKYLLCMVAFTVVGLLAWTVTAMQSTSPPSSSSPPANSVSAVIGIGRTKSGDIYTVCTFFHWNLIWHTLEFGFLSYGGYLSYKTRITNWSEKHQFAAAVVLEMVVSLTAIIIKKHVWLDSNPDLLLLLSFLHVHCTVTVVVVLIMATKLYHARLAPTARDQSTTSSGAYRMHPSLAKLRDNLMNGTIDFAEMPISELNPEDIRAELKRVYTQLRMYKLTNLYMDNPHISKRKGGKKTSNRQTNRRLSIPTVPSKTSHKEMTKQAVSEMDERSSLTKGAADDEGASAGSITDVTIHTSPHNVYFSKTINKTDNRLRLDSDLSVCI